MQGEIIGEDNKDIGTKITDNSGIKHQIEMHKQNGEIYAHESDGYADDPADRTFEENEHVAQAQRFAKWYVYRQRGYDTMPPLPNPDRISVVTVFIDSLSPETFEEYFGDLYQQMRSHAGHTEPVIDVPAAAESNPMYYRKDVYLDISHEDLQTFVTESPRDSLEALQQAAETTATTDTTDLFELWNEIAEETPAIDHSDEQRLAELFIEAVSGVHLMWSPANNQTETIQPDMPDIERKPDARIEMPPYDLDSIEQFREDVVFHLKCQIRDCYLTMGIAPPESLRIQGPGLFDRSTWFQHYDVYEPYHRDDVEITDWQEQYTPEEMLA